MNPVVESFPKILTSEIHQHAIRARYNATKRAAGNWPYDVDARIP
jgi:hypothetical protein